MNLNLCKLLQHPAGASRKHSFIDQSTTWIKQEMPPKDYPTILDIGCGPGLYAERLCRAGYQVTGIDFSRRSIDYARASANQQQLNIHYYQQNYLHLDINDTFDMTVFIYCDYGALSPSDRAVVLQAVYSTLKAGGKLLLDVFSDAYYGSFKESQTWDLCANGGFWSSSEYLEISESSKYAPDLTLRQTVILAEQKIKQFYLWDTCFTPEKLTKEAQAAGFKVYGFYDDVAGMPYTGKSPTIAAILQK